MATFPNLYFKPQDWATQRHLYGTNKQFQFADPTNIFSSGKDGGVIVQPNQLDINRTMQGAQAKQAQSDMRYRDPASYYQPVSIPKSPQEGAASSALADKTVATIGSNEKMFQDYFDAFNTSAGNIRSSLDSQKGDLARTEGIVTEGQDRLRDAFDISDYEKNMRDLQARHESSMSKYFDEDRQRQGQYRSDLEAALARSRGDTENYYDTAGVRLRDYMAGVGVNDANLRRIQGNPNAGQYGSSYADTARTNALTRAQLEWDRNRYGDLQAHDQRHQAALSDFENRGAAQMRDFMAPRTVEFLNAGKQMENDIMRAAQDAAARQPQLAMQLEQQLASLRQVNAQLEAAYARMMREPSQEAINNVNQLLQMLGNLSQTQDAANYRALNDPNPPELAQVNQTVYRTPVRRPGVPDGGGDPNFGDSGTPWQPQREEEPRATGTNMLLRPIIRTPNTRGTINMSPREVWDRSGQPWHDA
jgi:hypothetical protein